MKKVVRFLWRNGVTLAFALVAILYAGTKPQGKCKNNEISCRDKNSIIPISRDGEKSTSFSRDSEEFTRDGKNQPYFIRDKLEITEFNVSSNFVSLEIITPGEGMLHLYSTSSLLQPWNYYSSTYVAETNKTNVVVALRHENQKQFFVKAYLSEVDSDLDGLSDREEKILGTNPNRADTDLDGLSDYEEAIAGTSPTQAVFNVEIATNNIASIKLFDKFISVATTNNGIASVVCRDNKVCHTDLSMPTASLRKERFYVFA